MDCGKKRRSHPARLRLARGLTQASLAQAIGVSPKAVSKWETGRRVSGPVPAAPLGSDAGGGGGLPAGRGGARDNAPVPGNMKHIRFFVCPDCGSITTSTGNAQVSCCGRPLAPLDRPKGGRGPQAPGGGSGGRVVPHHGPPHDQGLLPVLHRLCPGGQRPHRQALSGMGLPAPPAPAGGTAP